MPTRLTEQDGALQARIEFEAPPVVRNFIEDPTYCTGYFGPWGCAKTTAGAFKAWGYGQAFPGARIAVIRNTWPNLRDTTQKTIFEWFPEDVAGHYVAQSKTFFLHPAHAGEPPVELIFRAMFDQADLENLLSLDLAAAWIDEPQGGISYRGERGLVHEPGINQRLFEALMARIGRQQGYPPMAWLTGNPPSPSHFIARLFGYDPGASSCDRPKNPRPDYHLYLGTQETNRHNLTPGYYERLTRDMGENTPMARRFLKGLWIDFAQSKPFHREWILRAGQGGAPKIPEDLLLEIGLDPAISKKDAASKSAIVIGGQVEAGDLRGRKFITHAEAGHWTVLETVNRLLLLCRRFNVRRVRIEKVAFQAAVGEVLDQKAREAGLNVVVQLVTPDADKLTRANAWAPMVEAGELLFGPGLEELVEAMLAVPDDETAWDYVDAAGYLVRGFRKVQAAAERLPTEDPDTPLASSYATRPQTQPRWAEPAPGAPLRARPVAKSGDRRRATGYAVTQPRAPRRPSR